MYHFIYFTNLPSFYKVNLFNRISEHRKILVIFTGRTANIRNSDFFSSNLNFDYISLGGQKALNKLYITCKVIRNNYYEELIVTGVNDWISWLCIFLSPVRKNATVVESSYHEATISGIRGFLKSIFFKRISVTYASGKSQEKLARLHKFNGKIIITKGVGVFNVVKQPQYIPSKKVENFIYVGRLSSEKNLKFLITVFNKLPNYNLHIVGYGPEELELRDLSKENVKFHGAVDNKSLFVLYQSCDVFILPSQKEPWGLVVEEALNNGLPVLVSNKVGCAEEIVQENYNGLVFDYSSESSLLAKIERIVDPDFYNLLKKNISKIDFNEIINYQVDCYL